MNIMNSSNKRISQDPIAAAVAAAAEIAKSGGYFIHSPAQQQLVTTAEASHHHVSGRGVTVSESECSSVATSVSITPLRVHAAQQDYNNSYRTQCQREREREPLSSDEDEEEDESEASRLQDNYHHHHHHHHHQIHNSEEDEDQEEEDEEEDLEVRMARSRERNREHARRTRLRKKAQLEALQSKVKGLQAESQVLKQSLEECSIASILVGLSHKTNKTEDAIRQSLLQVATLDTSTCHKEAEEIIQLVGGKRKRFVSPEAIEHKSASNQPLKIKINGKTTSIGGGKTHINWKTGVYSDEHGNQKQLTQKQLESLRRERNRMHAKMTRDRKKNFIAVVEKTIHELESNNSQMKKVLAQVVETHFHNHKNSSNNNNKDQKKTSGLQQQTSSTPFYKVACPVTPETTSTYVSSEDLPPMSVDHFSPSRPAKRTRHSWDLPAN